MGSTNFSQYYEGTDLRTVYDRAVEAARHEHGADPYNGTISTTSGVSLHQREAVSLAEAIDIANSDEALEDYSKWEACGAIPVTSNPKQRKVKVRATTEQEGFLLPSERAALIEGKVELRPGERIGTTEVVEDRTRRKLAASRTEGKAVTRYEIVGRPHYGKFESAAAARAKAKALVREYLDNPAGHRGESRLEIRGVVEREGGGPLDVIEAQQTRRSVTIEATLVTRDPNAPIRGYVLFGWVAM